MCWGISGIFILSYGFLSEIELVAILQPLGTNTYICELWLNNHLAKEWYCLSVTPVGFWLSGKIPTLEENVKEKLYQTNSTSEEDSVQNYCDRDQNHCSRREMLNQLLENKRGEGI